MQTFSTLCAEIMKETASTFSADDNTQLEGKTLNVCMKGTFFVHEDNMHFLQQTALCVHVKACCLRGKNTARTE